MPATVPLRRDEVVALSELNDFFFVVRTAWIFGLHAQI